MLSLTRTYALDASQHFLSGFIVTICIFLPAILIFNSEVLIFLGQELYTVVVSQTFYSLPLLLIAGALSRNGRHIPDPSYQSDRHHPESSAKASRSSPA